MKPSIRYRDRRHAGRVLASYLMDLNVGDNPLVLALPRGGVPVGVEVAEAIGASMDIFIVRKIGLPVQPEFAMGSLALGGLRLLDHSLIQEAGVSAEELARVTEREERELARREELYRAGRPPLELAGREVIVVDDGLATGFTLRVAALGLRKLGCSRITAAVPVGAPDACDVVAREVDQFVCPLQPSFFHSVSLWYEDFAPTDDDEVRDCLESARLSGFGNPTGRRDHRAGTRTAYRGLCCMNKDSDGHKENLTGNAAIDKIRAIIKSARTCLFGTLHDGFPLTVRPMGVQAVDDAGNVWFLSGRSSIKNAHIKEDPRVQLLFSNSGDSEYLSLQGSATITDDPAIKEKYWNSIATAWFPGGVDDPELTVIKVVPQDGHYWDTEHGKAIALAKIIVSGLTGKPTREGVEGKVRP